MIVTISNGELKISISQFLKELPQEDKLYLGRLVMFQDKESIKSLIQESTGLFALNITRLENCLWITCPICTASLFKGLWL
jgi:hypothetical protein